jgi:hypothetical protein
MESRLIFSANCRESRDASFWNIRRSRGQFCLCDKVTTETESRLLTLCSPKRNYFPSRMAIFFCDLFSIVAFWYARKARRVILYNLREKSADPQNFFDEVMAILVLGCWRYFLHEYRVIWPPAPRPLYYIFERKGPSPRGAPSVPPFPVSFSWGPRAPQPSSSP